MIADFCTVETAQGIALLPVLFMAGLTGGVAHCALMCGPIVLARAGARLESIPVGRLCELSRLRAGALLPYHLGRITTYAGLGALAGFGGAALLPSSRLRAGLLLAGALYFLVQAGLRLRLFHLPARPPLRHVPGLTGALAGVRALFHRGVMAMARLGAFPLGLLLGFLPCGLVYGSLMAVAGSGDSLMGALAMAAFGLGTVPALVAVGVAGQLARGGIRTRLAQAAPFLMLAIAGLLSAFAVISAL